MAVGDITYGPVPLELVGRSVDVEQFPDRVEVFYERDLIGTFNPDGTAYTESAIVTTPSTPIPVTTQGQTRVVREGGLFSFEGELYGPLPGSFTGTSVVARREGKLVVATDEDGNQIATFPVANG